MDLLSTFSFASGGHFEPPYWWVSFFVALLLCIAIFPLVAEHWWENNKNKGIIAGVLAVPVFVYTIIESPAALGHSAHEYFSFIVLLWALYTVSGGIVVRGSLKGKPVVNLIFLAVGAVIANIFGTTGAAMLLIRPLLRTNEHRQYKKHIVIFFVFLVANVGGCLTPLGDPPLFLGFLRGVPFAWTLKLFPIWFPTLLVLLGIFFIWDVKAWKKESEEVKNRDVGNEKFAIVGKINFLFIIGVMLSTIFSPQLSQFSETIGFGLGGGSPWREFLMILMGLFSMMATPKTLRKENRFNFDAIIEVAVLFAGIFVTMIPALALLKTHGNEMGLTQPWQFMWVTGILSSFLDNAPTYLVFATTGASVAGVDSIREMVGSGAGEVLLKGISVGAVFMGANTYIGNAPNFMVKVIADTADERAVKMPSFFGYMAYSGLILLPVYAVMTLIFFGFIW